MTRDFESWVILFYQKGDGFKEKIYGDQPTPCDPLYPSQYDIIGIESENFRWCSKLDFCVVVDFGSYGGGGYWLLSPNPFYFFILIMARKRFHGRRKVPTSNMCAVFDIPLLWGPERAYYQWLIQACRPHFEGLAFVFEVLEFQKILLRRNNLWLPLKFIFRGW